MIRIPPTVFAAFVSILCASLVPAQDEAKGKFTGPLPILPGVEGKVPLQQTYTLEMRRDGSTFHDGTPIDYTTLRDELIAFAKAHPDPAMKVASRHVSLGQLHLRLHPDLPYDALYRLLLLCSERELMIYRVFLGVRAKKDGPELAMPMFLPVDDEPRNPRMVNVELRYSRPPISTRLLVDRFAGIDRGRANPDGPPLALLKPEAHTPIDAILRVAQAARRSGLDEFGFAHLGKVDYPDWAKGSQDFKKLVAASRPRPGSAPGVWISGPTRNTTHEVEEEIEEVAVEELEVIEEVVDDVKEGDAPAPTERGSKLLRNRNRPPAGADVAAKSSVDLALQWLAKHQDEDGKWDCDGFMKHDRLKPITDGPGNPVHDVGVTGLALLAFLGQGNTMRAGPYKEQVKNGVRWLRQQQGRNGLFGVAASHDFIYDHAIATLAMCEAYGLSEYKTLKKSAQGGINYLESHRNPYAVWRYQPRDNDNDMSVTSWCLMAYRSAKDFKLQVNPTVFKLVGNYIDELTDPNTGRVGYTKRGEPSSRHPGDHSTRFSVDLGEAMTAAGLFSRFLLNQVPAKSPVMDSSAMLILEKPPAWKKDGRIDFYYWFYGSHAMYQMGGRHWETWRRSVYPALIANQRKDGSATGSWDPVNVWGEDGGRIYATAMAALTLESVYRYARILNR